MTITRRLDGAFGVIIAALLLVAFNVKASQGCLTCHPQSTAGFVSGHDFGPDNCSLCHGDGPAAESGQEAHQRMVAFPGNLSNAESACGDCHREHVRAVKSGQMANGFDMVRKTRAAFGEAATDRHDTLSSLGHSPADSLLRKLCASCHLHQDKKEHAINPVEDRGGGCLGCHINEHDPGEHPALSARVDGARCFGCHSRSGRISLNYAGLGEVDDDALQRPDTSSLGRLDDHRLVEKLKADRHHQAGMSCMDCHTASVLMGIDNPDHEVGVSCADCHIREDGVTEKPETPLRHIEASGEGYLLHRKSDGKALSVPMWSKQNHPNAQEHQRLSCNACHSQWAPQCHGCHVEYDPNGRQWDHVEQIETEGRWSERRWNVRNDLPPLGVTADNRIEPFVPGMIMTVDHPQFTGPLFRRLFAPLVPHTSGPARDCNSCHRTSVALGLGTGQLEKTDGRWTFLPALEVLPDGLPADAWTNLEGTRGGDSLEDGARPFSTKEIERILEATIP